MDAQTTELAAPGPTAQAGPVGPVRRRDPAAAPAAIALALILAVVVLAGIGGYLIFGAVPHGGFDPPGLVDHLGGGRDALAAPFARWDSVWYLTIAGHGYRPGPTAAFFPLYPLLVDLVAGLGPGLLIGGVLVSVSCLLVALYLLWQLTDLELGAAQPDAASLTVYATALGPMAFFFTAVYSESLFLALSVGAFLAARRGRWAQAGALGAFAAATRSQGVLLMGALTLLYLEQRRGSTLGFDRRPPGTTPAPAPAPTPTQAPGHAAAPPRPRRRAVVWLLAVPVGLVAYLGWLWLAGLDPLAPFAAQQTWFRHFAGPLGGVLQGARAAWGGAQQLLSGQTRTIYFAPAGGDPMIAAWHNLTLFVFLLGALVPLIGALRRLPPAYGGYALASLVLAVSYPVAPQPLTSLPRLLVVVFPLAMAVGLWLARHPRLRLPALAGSTAALAVNAGLFATWHWIA